MQSIENNTLKKLKSLVPKLLSSRHKGQNGRIGVIGGCFEYTGAPFYSALSILKGGGDLAHIFCTSNASTPIKSYSPEVIVHPYLFSSEDISSKLKLSDKSNNNNLLLEEQKQGAQQTVDKMLAWYNALHSFVLGPGLGRDQVMSFYLTDLVNNLLKTHILVVDADGLWYLSSGPQKEQFWAAIRERAALTVLTPNINEFETLFKSFQNSMTIPASANIPYQTFEQQMQQQQQLNQQQQQQTQSQSQSNSTNSIEDLSKSAENIQKKAQKIQFNLLSRQRRQELAENMDFGSAETDFMEIEVNHEFVKDVATLASALNNINILLKGKIDIITNGKKAFLVRTPGSLKRCGGIGDILSGLTGLYAFWAKNNIVFPLSNLGNSKDSQNQQQQSNNQKEEVIEEDSKILYGCILSSYITRKASFKAFEQYKYALTAPNVIEKIGESFNDFYFDAKL